MPYLRKHIRSTDVCIQTCEYVLSVVVVTVTLRSIFNQSVSYAFYYSYVLLLVIYELVLHVETKFSAG